MCGGLPDAAHPPCCQPGAGPLQRTLNPMSTPIKKPRHFFFLLAVLFAMGGATLLHGQGVREMTDAEKSERAEIQRQAASTRAEDRCTAVEKLACLYMDYSLLWQLMNDADPGVRETAISAMTSPSCTAVADRPLSPALAQKMAAMLEQEVTPERIRTAFAPGPQRDAAATLATSSAITLHHLQQYESLMKSPADCHAWQQRVLAPLFQAAASSSPPAVSMHLCTLNLLPLFTDPALLQQALPVILQKLDDPALPAPWLLPTLEALWSHPLLGHDRPLHLLLLVQLAPRLPPLRTRILAPMKNGQAREQAARLIDEIAAAIRTAYEKIPPAPTPATAEPK
jgi:hypothetical protein